MSHTPYGGDRFQLPSNPLAPPRFSLRNSTYVTVHNGFEVQNIIGGTKSTKCYPHFDEVILQLRRDFPNLTFIQLGSKTSTPIPSVHQNLIGKTTLEEASTLIAGALCHLDNESGLVHIASCHGTPCCVVLGPTRPTISPTKPTSIFARKNAETAGGLPIIGWTAARAALKNPSAPTNKARSLSLLLRRSLYAKPWGRPPESCPLLSPKSLSSLTSTTTASSKPPWTAHLGNPIQIAK